MAPTPISSGELESNAFEILYLLLVELFVAPLCQYPLCERHVFFDRRINEDREWRSDRHMMMAVKHQIEMP